MNPINFAFDVCAWRFLGFFIQEKRSRSRY